MLPRNLLPDIWRALKDTPVVVATGPSRVGDRFRRGVLLYAGRETLAFGPQLHALPLDALWTL